MTDTPNKTLTERGMDWLFSQATSTVLLFALFAFLWVKAPEHIQAIQSGYEKLMSKFEAEQFKTRETYTRSIEVMREEHKLDRMQRERLSHEERP